MPSPSNRETKPLTGHNAESTALSAALGPEVSRADERAGPQWTFLSNHAHVLLLIAQNPEIRLRDMATMVGITERAVQRIVADLEEGRYLERQKQGRRNIYRIHPELPLRHPLEAHKDVGRLLSLILD
jgi:predicted transcriptional regulator